ncbi:hypothetical protein DSUL_190002 [Desulfovibrionales bacterium]
MVVAAIDAGEGFCDQDLRLVGQAVEAQRGLVVMVNKWDLMGGRDPDGQRLLKEQLGFCKRYKFFCRLLRYSEEYLDGAIRLEG